MSFDGRLSGLVGWVSFTLSVQVLTRVVVERVRSFGRGVD